MNFVKNRNENSSLLVKIYYLLAFPLIGPLPFTGKLTNFAFTSYVPSKCKKGKYTFTSISKFSTFTLQTKYIFNKFLLIV